MTDLVSSLPYLRGVSVLPARPASGGRTSRNAAGAADGKERKGRAQACFRQGECRLQCWLHWSTMFRQSMYSLHVHRVLTQSHGALTCTVVPASAARARLLARTSRRCRLRSPISWTCCGRRMSHLGLIAHQSPPGLQPKSRRGWCRSVRSGSDWLA